MGKYNEKLMKAGALIALDGLTFSAYQIVKRRVGLNQPFSSDRHFSPHHAGMPAIPKSGRLEFARARDGIRPRPCAQGFGAKPGNFAAT